MKALTMLLKVLTAGVAILVFQMIAGALVPIKATMPPHTLPWLLVANFMTAAVLVLIASRSEWRGSGGVTTAGGETGEVCGLRR
jgi:hypothetical protein